MRNKFEQLSLFDIYTDVSEAIEQQKPELIRLMEEHIDFKAIMPLSLKIRFQQRFGRRRIYHPESFVRALVVQKLFGIATDALLIRILRCSSELRDFCGFCKVPDAAKFTRFRKDYADGLKEMFEHLVELTEPICREIDPKKADYLIYDTTGIELRVNENNPKFFDTKLRAAKKFAKGKDNYNPYAGVYSMLPDVAKANADARQQYINGHFCYAVKAGVITNGLGVVRHLSFFDDDFRKLHPELSVKKADNPEKDKEIGDSGSLRPALSDFFREHPEFSYGTFLGDAAFDSYDIYSMLKDEFRFERACIPMNLRNTKSSDANFDSYGNPVCPRDGTPFRCLGKSGGKNRSMRFKWVCHKSVAQGSTRKCVCENPCTDSSYGKCVYTYPGKDFRLCPGIARNTEHWNHLYRHRVLIERTINLMKDTFALDARKSLRTVSAKADIYLAGIVQLIGVLMAKSMQRTECFKSVRRLMAA